MKNIIFLEDCINTLYNKEIKYDYIFCVPPDFDELKLHPIKDALKYTAFLKKIFMGFSPRCNIVTIAITDRKYQSAIITKHELIIKLMQELGYTYISQKIWCKSIKINLYRLNYSFIMSFAKKPYKQQHDKEYEIDVWNHPIYSYLGYNYAIALEVVKHCVINFTQESAIVYDPFMGSATTAIACLETNRFYLGSEINQDFYNIGQDRINLYNNHKENMKQQLMFPFYKILK